VSNSWKVSRPIKFQKANLNSGYHMAPLKLHVGIVINSIFIRAVSALPNRDQKMDD